MRAEIIPAVPNDSCVAILVAVVLKKLVQFEGELAPSVLNRVTFIAPVYVHSWSVDLGTAEATKLSVLLQYHFHIFRISDIHETEFDIPMAQCFIVF